MTTKAKIKVIKKSELKIAEKPVIIKKNLTKRRVKWFRRFPIGLMNSSNGAATKQNKQSKNSLQINRKLRACNLFIQFQTVVFVEQPISNLI